MNKTPDYLLKSHKAYLARKKKDGWIRFDRLIKPEWKVKFEELLKQLKQPKE